MQITVAVAAMVVAFVVAMLSGRVFVPMLHKLKFGQTIREIGPAWHKNKQGTPTIGGVIFITGFVAALVVAVAVSEWFLPVKPLSGASVYDRVRLIAGVVLALACGAIGFADDYIKVVKKRNLGLTASQKMALQLIAASGYATVMYFLGGASVIDIPFLGQVDIGWWFIPLCIFFAVGFPNATNLTDGVDGLCGSITVVASVCMAVVAAVVGSFGHTLVALVFAGAVVGFLVWNTHPAKVFMGDTGSLLIGGLLCALAFGLGQPVLLLPIGIMYIIETLSVMLQVSYFKLTHGKRLFKMSPIHHHFEMCGWSENKIVTVFCLVTAIVGGGSLVFLFY
ncbi:MAG: phospho-N-acetylmuramoyl-pentapeptide-transferase [Clostridia bacterium]|nr:phospho-N-acetylmuramoyl-pentapeptide-transferase [Clostridia bacterium]